MGAPSSTYDGAVVGDNLKGVHMTEQEVQTQPPDLNKQRAQISAQAEAVLSSRTKVDEAEAALTCQAEDLAKLVQQYNRERLYCIIEMLVSKGLAYFAENSWSEGILVKEDQLSFETNTGVEEVWRGSEYYERLEMQAYSRTYLICRANGRTARSPASKGQTVRQRSTADFTKRLQNVRNKDLPGWLLVAIDTSNLPPEPMECRTSSLDSQFADKNRLSESVVILRYADTPLRVPFRESKNFLNLTSILR